MFLRMFLICPLTGLHARNDNNINFGEMLRKESGKSFCT